LENTLLPCFLGVAFPLLSTNCGLKVKLGGTEMQFLSNTAMILTIAFLSFEFSFFLSRGLLSLVLHSMQRFESRVKSH
jgi:hypothetical protein